MFIYLLSTFLNIPSIAFSSPYISNLQAMPIRIRVTNFLRYSSILPKPGLHRLSRFHSRFSRIDSASIAASFVEAATHPSSKYQIYLSNSTDPFLNLSIEHYLLEKAPTYSTILFLYTNRPSLVIGRNQNPWVEIDLKALEGAPALGLRSNMEKVDLLRRRSGGGTVFHDYGNLNFCVICPRADFTRDKHAEMVTRAIRKLNPRARVNQRHDIVLDQGSLQDNDENQPDPEDMHRSAYHSEDINLPPLKVSGSAYKILNGSALHHGTCLVTSLNLKTIPTLLNSPAKHFMEAKGAASCPSPVGNIHEVDAESVYDMVIKVEFLIVDAFAAMYGISQSTLAPLRAMNENNFTHRGSDLVCGFVGGELMKVPAIMSGMEELKVRLLWYGKLLEC